MAKVLHVTEAASAGTLVFMFTIAARQAVQGADVHVLYTERSDSPPREEIEERFTDAVAVHPAVTGSSKIRTLLRLWRTIREEMKSGQYDAVHLHSALAGGIGRLASVGLASAPLVVYSPHGFPFLRLDLAAPIRRLTFVFECLLARRSLLVVTSRSEVDLARDRLKAPRVEFLRSGVPGASVSTVPPVADPDRRLRVVMVGRVAYQKAPWRFATVARALHDHAEFMWIGGGTTNKTHWLEDAPVTIVPWVSPAELDEILDASDLCLFPTLWEGMSLSLIRIQARGIPAVTTDVVGNRDAVKDGVTGYVCTTDDGLIDATRRLLTDSALRAQFSIASLDWAREQFADDLIGEESLEIYRAGTS